MRKIAGIDYSLTSPAICIWKSTNDRLFDFDSCDLYYLENSQRWKSTTATSHGILNLHPEEYPKWNTEEERHDLLSAFYKRLTSDDAKERLEAARAWAIWEGSTSKLYSDPSLIERFGEDEFAEAFARIECHYFINGGWFSPEDQLLQNIDIIREIPAVIVQGRYDVVCPVVSAWDLHKAWPEAEFCIIQDAGHSMTEPGIRSKLLDSTDTFAEL